MIGSGGGLATGVSTGWAASGGGNFSATGAAGGFNIGAMIASSAASNPDAAVSGLAGVGTGAGFSAGGSEILGSSGGISSLGGAAAMAGVTGGVGVLTGASFRMLPIGLVKVGGKGGGRTGRNPPAVAGGSVARFGGIKAGAFSGAAFASGAGASLGSGLSSNLSSGFGSGLGSTLASGVCDFTKVSKLTGFPSGALATGGATGAIGSGLVIGAVVVIGIGVFGTASFAASGVDAEADLARKIDSSAVGLAGSVTGSLNLIGGMCCAPGFFVVNSVTLGGCKALAGVAAGCAGTGCGVSGLPESALQPGAVVFGGSLT